jgi:glycosyltransferase involved in cell wall biosynthesis
LNLRPDDFVLMNTVAIYDNYRDFILLWLKNKRLKHAYWFIHEDISQLPVIHKEFLDKNNIKQIHGLINDNKLSILVPSLRTKNEYDQLLDTSLVNNINLHVDINNKFKIKRTQKEYDRIDFLISGTPADGRKGQVLALSAFTYFYYNYFLKKPSEYRDFKLHLVAIGDDYISQQIKWICESLLSDHSAIYPSLPKEEALEITSMCNVVICCSLNETFGLYVAEAMLMGHVVLRNNSAGVDEQLVNGENGYLIDHKDIKHFAKIIDKILNKKTSNSSLQNMGKTSQIMISKYSKNNYLSQIDNII